MERKKKTPNYKATIKAIGALCILAALLLSSNQQEQSGTFMAVLGSFILVGKMRNKNHLHST